LTSSKQYNDFSFKQKKVPLKFVYMV
jgi:hypothetical protein